MKHTFSCLLGPRPLWRPGHTAHRHRTGYCRPGADSWRIAHSLCTGVARDFVRNTDVPCRCDCHRSPSSRRWARASSALLLVLGVLLGLTLTLGGAR